MDSTLDGLSGSIVRNPETGSPIRLAHVPRPPEPSQCRETHAMRLTHFPRPPEPPQCRETHVQPEDTTSPQPGQYSQRSHLPPAKITVHWLEQSRAFRILWLLEELSLRYSLKSYKRDKYMRANPKLRAVHPLGKSPIVEIESATHPHHPLILAESGHIVEFLSGYYGQWLIPLRYPRGQEGQIGAESESWLRYFHLLHYAEGSFMPLNLAAILTQVMKRARIPLLGKPFTYRIACGISWTYLAPEYEKHFEFIESLLATAPQNGEFLCGNHLTGADTMVHYALECARNKNVVFPQRFPLTFGYLERLEKREAFQRARARVTLKVGEFKGAL